MSPVVDATLVDGDLGSALFYIPESIEKLVFPSTRSHENHHHHQIHHRHETTRKGFGSLPVDIIETDKDYVFYFDVPGLSKSDIQVTVEEDNILVIKSGGKRKREEGEEEGCKYIRFERKASNKFLRKFRLPDNSNVSAISAKCENGVLSVTVEKLPPPLKAKTVEVAIS